LVYTVALGLLLTISFDLTRIAAMGIIFYHIMDIAAHWGVLRYFRHEVEAQLSILIVLVGFVWIKIVSDPLVVAVACAAMVAILIMEVLFLRSNPIVVKMHCITNASATEAVSR
jgi:hypothetical protein